MEATCSSETSIDFQWATRHFILEDESPHNYRYEKFKSYNMLFVKIYVICFSLMASVTCVYIVTCFILHVATMNMDSPDLTRKFIGTIQRSLHTTGITHNFAFDNTQRRVF
jgi:hypothetical protein